MMVLMYSSSNFKSVLLEDKPHVLLMYDTWPTAQRRVANRHPTARVVVINCLEQHIDTLSVFL